MKALIVEDEDELAAEMVSFLKKYYLCDVASTAKEAIEKTDAGIYDFILLDIGLPDKDGFYLLQELKKDYPDTAILMLTARGNVETGSRGLTWALMIICPNLFPCLSCTPACRL